MLYHTNTGFPGILINYHVSVEDKTAQAMEDILLSNCEQKYLFFSLWRYVFNVQDYSGLFLMNKNFNFYWLFKVRYWNVQQFLHINLALRSVTRNCSAASQRTRAMISKVDATSQNRASDFSLSEQVIHHRPAARTFQTIVVICASIVDTPGFKFSLIVTVIFLLPSEAATPIIFRNYLPDNICRHP